MTEPKCRSCGTFLPPGVNFCRQCGTSISGNIATVMSERPTAVFDTLANQATQQFEARTTSPNPVGMYAPPGAVTPSWQPARTGRRKLIVTLLVILIALGAVGIVIVDKVRNRARLARVVSQPPVADPNLIYPGSQTIVDVTDPSGGRAIQLTTTDPLDRVENWYQSKFKLEKMLRLTSVSVIMKNQNVTITLVSADNQTAILIKQSP